MPERKEKIGSIFQPTLSDINTPTYVQQGVVDTSTAEAVSAIGAAGIGAWRGYEEAKVETEVEQVVSDLFERKAIEFESSEATVEERLLGAEEQAYMLAEEGFGENDPAVAEMTQSLAKLGRAKEIGKLNELEFSARVQDAVKRGINRMPGRADTFRKIAKDVLGDNSARIDMVFEMEQQRATAGQTAQKEYLKYLQRASTFNGKPPTAQTEADLRDYQLHLAAKNQEEQAKIIQADQLRTTDAKVAHASQYVNSLLLSSMQDTYSAINSVQVKGKPITQLQAEHGGSMAAVIDILAKDETALNDFSRTLLGSLKNTRLKVHNFYTTEARRTGIKATEYDPEKDSQLKVVDDMINIVESGLDKSQLKTLFETLNTQNKTRVENVFVASPSLKLMQATGISREVASLYHTSPELVKSLYGQNIFNDLKTVFDGNNPVLTEQVTQGVINFSNGDVSLDELNKVSPLTARVSLTQARQGIDFIRQNGFQGEDSASLQKQKNTFIRYSQAVLGTISPTDPASLKVLHDHFGDPLYRKRLQELDGPQREQITESLINRYKNVIGSVDNRISVLGRVKFAEDTIRKETVSGLGKIKEETGIIIKNGKLTSKFSDELEKGFLDFSSVSVGHYKDHVNNVAQLNRLLEDEYNVLSMFEKIGPYGQFLKDFYNNKVLNKKKPESSEEQK